MYSLWWGERTQSVQSVVRKKGTGCTVCGGEKDTGCTVCGGKKDTEYTVCGGEKDTGCTVCGREKTQDVQSVVGART